MAALRPAAQSTTRGHRNVGPGRSGQQEFLGGRARGRLQSPPLLDRDEDRRYDAAPCDHLRPLMLARVEDFAETRLQAAYDLAQAMKRADEIKVE
jgi:hypothetical protein